MRAHYEALQQIVALRGGVENLSGLRGYLKSRVRQYEHQAYLTHSALRKLTLLIQAIYNRHFNIELAGSTNPLSRGRYSETIDLPQPSILAIAMSKNFEALLWLS
jgi:hypothetical protein